MNPPHPLPAAKTRLKVALAGVLGIAVLLGGVELYFGSRIFPGVMADGVAVGRMTVEEAAAQIAARGKIAHRPPVAVQAAGRSYTLSAAELGWRADALATAQAAFRIGREGGLANSLRERWAAWRQGVNVPVSGVVEKTVLYRRLEQLGSALKQSPKNAKVEFKNGRFVVTPDTPGRRFNVERAAASFLDDPSTATLELPMEEVAASVRASEYEARAAEANALLRPITLNYTQPGGALKTYTLRPEQVAGLMVLKKEGLEANPAAVRKLLRQVAKAYDQEAVNAHYVWGTSSSPATLAFTVVGEKSGWKLDQKAAEEALVPLLWQPDARTLDLPVVTVEPTLKAADLPEPSQLVLLSSATTTFKGSSAERIHNVRTAASRLDGYIIAPGETFSFNQAVGDIAPETGFKEGLVISGGRTVPGVGGGVCQVSTTTFRALYQAGLPVVERNPHAYRVHWYDPIIGFDAAVYQPYLDLRMKNDTPSPLLLRTYYDPDKVSLTVSVWGLPIGRTVTISDPVILSRTPHPPAKYIEDDSLRPGVRKQIDWAADGYSVRLSRTITDASGTRTEVLSTRYRPWQAVYLVGPSQAHPGR
ncbi:VanW family protein [Allomeiothermus silvanus]|uniref:VanW family protein n=1 Tax=Allomeiothermus silvanus TaxID=52022 RepID=UPI0023F0235D|nr:VanW family protein [Allomeiothermus silvanus]